jgi:metal-responsive CopG/Arc/MetJ family transcriptional regulator
VPNNMVRTTLTLPADLLEAADRAVRDGKSRSRNAFVASAIRRELDSQRRAEIAADLADMGRDADYLHEAERIMTEFASSDVEASRLVDAEHGAYPYDEAELAELSKLAKSP